MRHDGRCSNPRMRHTPTTPAADRPLPPALLSLTAARDYLGGDVSLETLRTWTRTGVLRKVKIGRRLFVLRASIDDLIAEQLAEGDSDA